MANPKHRLTSFLGEKFRWKIELEGDKILTLFYYSSENTLKFDAIDNLFLESLARLTLGRNILFLNSLSFREIENFLRDENHLPVFGDSSLPEIQAKKCKYSLLAAILSLKLTQTQGNLPVVFWDKLTLVEKNSNALELIQKINQLFSSSIPMQLAIAENDLVSVIRGDFPLDIEVTQLLFQEYFQHSNENSSLKVVAVQ